MGAPAVAVVLSSALSRGACHCGEGARPVHPDCPGLRSRVHSLFPLWEPALGLACLPCGVGLPEGPRELIQLKVRQYLAPSGHMQGLLLA